MNKLTLFNLLVGLACILMSGFLIIENLILRGHILLLIGVANILYAVDRK